MSDAWVARGRARLRGAAVAAALLALAACEGGGPFGGDPEAEAALAEVAAALGGDAAAETAAGEAAAPDSEAAAGGEPNEPPEEPAEVVAETQADTEAEEPAQPEAAQVEAPTPDPNAAARAACKRRGGIFTTRDKGKVGYCAKYTRDANKTCDASTACEGYCLARSRTCAPVTPLFGCHQVLTDRGVASEICLN